MVMDDLGPIGVFDSGVGGLSVWLEIARQLPTESTIYLADQAHVPYGSRSLSEVRAYSEAITQFLLARRSKMIVVACNTASAAALHHLRRVFPEVPFVGMEPAIKPAAQHTRTGTVGVMATPATFRGELFSSLLQRYGEHVKVLTQVSPGLVEAVERGELDTPETEALLRRSLAPLLDADIDQLALGCTHYPFLRPLIERVAGPGVTVIDPAPAVARQVARVLAQAKLSRNGASQARHTFYSTGPLEPFAQMVQRLIATKAAHADLRGASWQGDSLAGTPLGAT